MGLRGRGGIAPLLLLNTCLYYIIITLWPYGMPIVYVYATVS